MIQDISQAERADIKRPNNCYGLDCQKDFKKPKMEQSKKHRQSFKTEEAWDNEPPEARRMSKKPRIEAGKRKTEQPSYKYRNRRAPSSPAQTRRKWQKAVRGIYGNKQEPTEAPACFSDVFQVDLNFNAPTVQSRPGYSAPPQRLSTAPFPSVVPPAAVPAPFHKSYQFAPQECFETINSSQFVPNLSSCAPALISPHTPLHQNDLPPGRSSQQIHLKSFYHYPSPIFASEKQYERRTRRYDAPPFFVPESVPTIPYALTQMAPVPPHIPKDELSPGRCSPRSCLGFSSHDPPSISPSDKYERRTKPLYNSPYFDEISVAPYAPTQISSLEEVSSSGWGAPSTLPSFTPSNFTAELSSSSTTPYTSQSSTLPLPPFSLLEDVQTMNAVERWISGYPAGYGSQEADALDGIDSLTDFLTFDPGFEQFV
ncbi:hypothetical protein H0H92_006234 [Tricholoma furcatifolium]|nr:hypothetical protein H0H92_006234 [Tricholoma furcatifolium]